MNSEMQAEHPISRRKELLRMRTQLLGALESYIQPKLFQSKAFGLDLQHLLASTSKTAEECDRRNRQLEEQGAA